MPAAVVLAACSSPVRLMPTPTLLVGADAASSDFVPEPERSPDIEIYYATNRLPVDSAAERRYSRQIGSKLHFGIARLRIGDADQTWDSISAYSTRGEVEDRPLIKLQSLQEMAALDGAPAALPAAAHAFFDDIDAALARSVDKDLVIYVHGANTTFERAAAQAAQCRHFTGSNSVMLVFGWPSQGILLRHSRAVGNARRSALELDAPPIQAVPDPILCKPYEEPTPFWEYTDGVPKRAVGRRPASYWFKSKCTGGAEKDLFEEENRDDLPLVNRLRDDVRRWRDSGYRGATEVTKDLLKHWGRADRARRLFFCQREAVETIIYLIELRIPGRSSRTGFSKFECTDEDLQKLLRGAAAGLQALERGVLPQAR